MRLKIQLHGQKEKEKVDFDSPVSERNNFRGHPLAISNSASAHNFNQTMGSFVNQSPLPHLQANNNSAVTPHLTKNLSITHKGR